MLIGEKIQIGTDELKADRHNKENDRRRSTFTFVFDLKDQTVSVNDYKLETKEHSIEVILSLTLRNL